MGAELEVHRSLHLPDRSLFGPSGVFRKVMVEVRLSGSSGARALLLAFVVSLFVPGFASAQESDEERLKAMHGRLLQAHRDAAVDTWMALESREFVSVNGGRVSFPSAEARREGREAYLESATFAAYRDLREPVVRVSEDGTLGWLVAEVEVRGSRREADGSRAEFHDVWAWVELYEKTSEGWKMVGNAANRRDAPPPAQTPAEEAIRRGRAFLGTPERLDGIRTLDVLAACRGPNGPFTTRVLSHRNGDMVFRQSYEDAPGFLAGIRGGRAWQVADSGEVETVSRESAAFLRSHEFLTITLMPMTRLEDPRIRDVGVFRGTVARAVELTDAAGNPFLVHYALEEGRPLGFTVTNPTSDGPPLIEVELADWREREGLRLPGGLTIHHGDQVWRYEFTRVRMNSLDDGDFDPEALVARDP